MGTIPKNTRVIEAGHFYKAKGPTKWSKIGWKILSQIKEKEDKTLLFIDDVHPIDCVHETEKHLPNIPFPTDPNCDFTVMESSVEETALQALEMLKQLSKKKKARLNGNGTKRWYCSGTALTHPDGYPTCTLLDLGLTLHKSALGFKEVINILPLFYKEQQTVLLRLIKKCLPSDFNFKVVLFNLNGEHQWL